MTLSDADRAPCRYPCMEHDEHVLLTPERFAALSDAQSERDAAQTAVDDLNGLVDYARTVIDRLTAERDAALEAALAVDRERIVALMDAERLAEALDHTIIHAEHYECEFVWCQEARAALALHRERRPAEEGG